MHGQKPRLRLVFAMSLSGVIALTPLRSNAVVVNDECAGALSLSAGQTIVETTDTSTFGGRQTSCQSNMGHDVWFSYSQRISGPVVFSTAGSTYDTILQLYSGSCTAPTPIDCNDDADLDNGVTTSILTNNIAANTTYYLQVGGYAATSGELHILATQQSSSQPYLSWSANATNLNLTWASGPMLQRATNLGAPVVWQDLNTSGSYTERMTNKARFFRLKK